MKCTPGPYHGKLVRGSLKINEKNRTYYVEIVFTIIYQAVNGAWQALMTPCERSLRMSCSPKAMPWTEKKLIALGFNGDFANMQFSDEAMSIGVGLSCEAESGTGENVGKIFEKWELDNWGDRTAAPDAGVDAARQLTAQFARTMQSQAPPVGTPPAGAAATQPTSQATSMPPAAGVAPATTHVPQGPGQGVTQDAARPAAAGLPPGAVAPPPATAGPGVPGPGPSTPVFGEVDDEIPF